LGKFLEIMRNHCYYFFPINIMKSRNSGCYTCVAVADSSTMDNHENLKCLTSLDLSDLRLIDSTKDGFATIVMKPIVDRARTSLLI
jgi:hypothetical protein